MGYTIGSGKDSRHDPGFTEQDFLARFQARQPEIVAYKKTHGGDLEGAYQAVTGEAWPTGRSVKVHGNGRAELTKDRTTKSVLGKQILLPAAMAAGGYFAAPAIAGMLAGSAGAGAGAAGGSLIGAGGTASGVGAGLAGLGSGAGVSSGLLGGLGTAASLGGGAGLSTAGMTSGLIGGAGGVGGTAGTTAASGGLLSTLGKAGSLGNLGEQFTGGAGASAEGRRADTMNNNASTVANNRAAVDAGQFNLDASQQRAQQVARGDMMSAAYTPVTHSGSGRDISFSGGLSQPFGADTTAAGEALKKQALLALMTQSDKLTTQLAQPQKAGAGENLMAGVGMGANVLSGLSTASKLGKYGRMLT